MSRGRGAVERYIHEWINRNYLQLIPEIALAYTDAQVEGVEFTPHLRASSRRAARKLAAAGDVSRHEVFARTASGYAGTSVWPTRTSYLPRGTTNGPST